MYLYCPVPPLVPTMSFPFPHVLATYLKQFPFPVALCQLTSIQKCNLQNFLQKQHQLWVTYLATLFRLSAHAGEHFPGHQMDCVQTLHGSLIFFGWLICHTQLFSLSVVSILPFCWDFLSNSCDRVLGNAINKTVY